MRIHVKDGRLAAVADGSLAFDGADDDIRAFRQLFPQPVAP